MKLLIITQKVDSTDSTLGFFHEWIKEMSAYFTELHVIALKTGEYDLPKNVEVYSLGKEKGVGKVGFILNFFKIARKVTRKVDSVFVHMNAIYLLLIQPFLGKRPLFYWKTHGHQSLLLRAMKRSPDIIFTASKESLSFSLPSIEPMGHGIDTSLFHCTSTPGKRVLTVGRITRTKGLHLLKGVAKKREVCAIGMSVTEDDKTYVRELNGITLPGPMQHKDLPKEYCNSRVIVNLSKTNSLDKVVLEAMASERLVLTSNPAFAPVLEKWKDLLICKRDERSVEEHINAIYSLTDEEYMSIARALRKEIIEKHNLQRLIEKLSRRIHEYRSEK